MRTPVSPEAGVCTGTSMVGRRKRFTRMSPVSGSSSIFLTNRRAKCRLSSRVPAAKTSRKTSRHCSTNPRSIGSACVLLGSAPFRRGASSVRGGSPGWIPPAGENVNVTFGVACVVLLLLGVLVATEAPRSVRTARARRLTLARMCSIDGNVIRRWNAGSSTGRE